MGLVALPTCLLFSGCGESAVAESSNASESVVVAAAPPPDAPDETVRHVVDGFLQHEPQRVWGALPASYQEDISGLISGFAEKMDADIYNRAFELVGRLGRLLEDQKELFLASEVIPQDIDREEMAANWDSLSGVIRTLVNSDIARLESLATMDVERFLATTGATLLAEAERAASAAGEDIFENLRTLNVELIEGDDEYATLRITGTELAEEIEMARVEDRWVPREMAEEWSAATAEARTQIEGMSREAMQAMKPQILGVFGMLEGTISQLESAETTQQLDQALQGIIFAVMGMMMGSAMQGGEMEFEGTIETNPGN